MSRDKTPIQELVWLYRLNQASLLCDSNVATALLETKAYHSQPHACPCRPWENCSCGCHSTKLTHLEFPASTPLS